MFSIAISNQIVYYIVTVICLDITLMLVRIIFVNAVNFNHIEFLKCVGLQCVGFLHIT